MIDLHSHLLPGLDDGASDMSDSMAIAAAAARDGVRVLAATPHVRHDYPTTPDDMELALHDVREALLTAGITLEVVPGGELALDALEQLTIDDLRRFGLAGNPGFALIEFPYDAWPVELAERLIAMLAVGVRPVLAHPERNSQVQAAPSRLAPLVAEGVLVQITASSLVGASGRRAQESARQLIDDGLAQLMASDVHGPATRANRMSDARAAIRHPALAGWLTEGVPGAILRGEDLPARPATGRRRRLPFTR